MYTTTVLVFGMSALSQAFAFPQDIQTRQTSNANLLLPPKCHGNTGDNKWVTHDTMNSGIQQFCDLLSKKTGNGHDKDSGSIVWILSPGTPDATSFAVDSPQSSDITVQQPRCSDIFGSILNDCDTGTKSNPNPPDAKFGGNTTWNVFTYHIDPIANHGPPPTS